MEHSLSVSVQVLKLHHTQSSLAQELVNKHTNFYGDDLGITLIDVITHEQSFEVFVKHLSLEYSLECLLSLIEFIQFQQLIDQHINNACAQFKVDATNPIQIQTLSQSIPPLLSTKAKQYFVDIRYRSCQRLQLMPYSHMHY